MRKNTFIRMRGRMKEKKSVNNTSGNFSEEREEDALPFMKGDLCIKIF